jgi:hypothetical protein
MPQLAKGGKWVFGWVVVGAERAIPIPPEAWDEYSFQPGEDVIFVPGSRTSGGFGVGTARTLGDLAGGLAGRALARGQFDAERRLALPPEIDAQPGDRLLAARGSGRALGFLARGPIYRVAVDHPDVVVFE